LERKEVLSTKTPTWLLKWVLCNALFIFNIKRRLQIETSNRLQIMLFI
jgi:hypothetical protein